MTSDITKSKQFLGKRLLTERSMSSKGKFFEVVNCVNFSLFQTQMIFGHYVASLIESEDVVIRVTDIEDFVPVLVLFLTTHSADICLANLFVESTSTVVEEMC